MTGAVAATFTVVVLLTGYANMHVSGWRERGIEPTVGWGATYAAQLVASLAVVPAIYPRAGFAASVSMAAFVWLAVLAISTDWRTFKVPYNIPHPVAFLGLGLMMFNLNVEAVLSFVMAVLGLVAVPLIGRAITANGLGMSDVRILWAAAATMSWWAGPTWLLYGLIGACLIQMLVRMVAGPLNLGQMVPVPRPAPADAGTPEAGPDGLPTVGDGDLMVDAPPMRMRRELAFAPALTLTLIVAVLAGTYLGVDACTTWSVTGTC